MTETRTPENLARQAAARAAALRQRTGDADRAPAPGDVFVFPEAARQPVQWVVLARDPARPGQLLAVAADANELVGTADLEIGDDTVGPLVLRSPFGGWLDEERLSPQLRVGALRSSRLSQAREHWFGDAVNNSVARREVDEDPEYQHWRKAVLQPAHASLFEPEARPRPRWPLFAAAAALVVTVGGVPIWLQQQKLQTVRREKALAEERLHKEAERIATYEATLAQGANDPSLTTTLRDLRTKLWQAWDSVAVVNAAIEVLRPAATRGRVGIKLPEGASHLVLVLKLAESANPEEELRYRLDLLPPGGTEALWSMGGLTLHPLQEVTVGLPVKLLEKGLAYDLRLVPEGSPESEGTLYLIEME
jgi:hypothetical protein